MLFLTLPRHIAIDILKHIFRSKIHVPNISAILKCYNEQQIRAVIISLNWRRVCQRCSRVFINGTDHCNRGKVWAMWKNRIAIKIQIQTSKMHPFSNQPQHTLSM